ncbi:hypothetical protein ADJ73_15715 [Arsenicicoccus sp. oral taxon 190]|nr:hypothetical protein ADJ73_15715 [Arsenicicoccus sp. oral taxon 190]
MVAAGAAVLLVLALLGTYLRRRLIAAGAPMFVCAYRRPGRASWRYGLARFESEHLVVFPLSGATLQPSHRVSRTGMALLHAGEPARGQAPLVEDPVVVALSDSGRQLEMVLPRDSYTAVRSWHEASPPGWPPRVA